MIRAVAWTGNIQVRAFLDACETEDFLTSVQHWPLHDKMPFFQKRFTSENPIEGAITVEVNKCTTL